MDYRKLSTGRFWGHVMSFPFIWLPIFPVLLLDIFVEVYQQICFPIYGLEIVKRSAYIQIRDRAKLQYLTALEKIDCMYCGYVNGVLLYWKEVAGRTEKYWCGIMHANKPGFQTHQDQITKDYASYGDEKDFEDKFGAGGNP